MMDLNPVNVVVLGATLLSAVASIVGFFWWREKVDAAWAEVAAKLKLEAKKSSWGHRCIAGKVGRYQVTIETVTKGSGKNSQTYTRYTVDGRGTFDPEMELKAESAWEGSKKVLRRRGRAPRGRRLRRGGQRQGAGGLAARGAGRTDARVVLRLVERPRQVKGGKITDRGRGGSLGMSASWWGSAQAMLAGADRLRVQDIAAALRTHAREDPSPGVRRRTSRPWSGGTARSARDPEGDRGRARRPRPGAAPLRRVRAQDRPRVCARSSRRSSTIPAGLTEAQRGQALELLVECFPYEAVAPRVARALDLPSEALRVAPR
jgi:hypothetical protein